MTRKTLFLSVLSTIFIFSACNQEVKKHCCDTGVQTFSNDSLQIFVPNAFTPNGDGINDNFTYFVNQPSAFSTHRLKVYKGAVIAFDKQDSNTLVWDGLIAGKQAKENVLNYSLLLKRKNVSTADSIVEIKGTICLRKKVPICAAEVTNCRFPDQISAIGFTVNTNENLDKDCQ